MTNKKKILIIDNSTGTTGAIRSILNITKFLSDSFEFSFALPSKNMISKLDKGNVHHVPFLEIQKSWKLIFYFPMLVVNTFRLINIIKKNCTRIIHVNDLYNMCGVLLKLLKPDLCVVYHVRLLKGSYVNNLYGIWIKLILKYADKIICVSKAVYKDLPQSSKKIVIYDSLPPITNADFNLDLDKFTYLYVGNFIPGKGHQYAIEVFEKVKRECEEMQLLFIGGDLGKPRNKEYKDALLKKVRGLGMEDHIHFIDELNYDELQSYYSAADVLLNFSESESFSMVCLEALIAGLPVIATACGGPEEIIDNYKNGILVENMNMGKMQEAMVTIYKNKELRNRLAVEAKKAREKFSLRKSANELIAVYNDCFVAY